MKHATLVVLLAAGMLALAPLSQAHADDDDFGAAALGFAFGAAISGAPAIIYQAPAPRVYVPARRYHHWRQAHRRHERREWRRHERREHRRHERRERQWRRWHRHHEQHHYHYRDED